MDVAARRPLRLLCALEGAPGATAPLAEALAGEAADGWWPGLAALLDAHGLAPWAFATLRRAGLAGAVPAEVAERLRGAWRAAALRNRVNRAELARVEGRLGEAGIALLPLKGASLLDAIYPEPGERPMQDLDLLVRPEAAAAAGEILAGLGYRRPRHPAAAGTRVRHFHETFTLSDRGVVLELHESLADAGLVAPARLGPLWERAVPGPGGRGLRLDPATEVAYVALHASKHGVFNALIARRAALQDAVLEPLSGNRLLWFLDLRRLLAAGGTTPAAAAERAGEWGAAPALHAGVVLAQRIFGAVPGWEWPGDPPPHGMSLPRALVSRALARGLASGSPAARRLLALLMRMDPVLHARPVRALELLDGPGRSAAVLRAGVSWLGSRRRRERR